MKRLSMAAPGKRALMAGAVVLAAVLTGCGGTPSEVAESSSAVSPVCDRDCLEGMIDQYVDALVAHDPSQLPVAADLRYTEDSAEAQLGEGIWQTITGTGGFRQDYLDVQNKIAASHVQLKEDDTNVLYSVLLYIDGEEISGIESLVQRVAPGGRFQPTMLETPLVGLNDPVPAGQQMPRQEMIDTALLYTEGLRIGSFEEANTPFAEDAYRVENGAHMAGHPQCPREECDDILTQDIITHPDVVASVAAVDEENGLVLLWMNFGDTNSYGPGNALITFEAFKVWGGEIHMVEAFFRTMPFETQRGWPAVE